MSATQHNDNKQGDGFFFDIKKWLVEELVVVEKVNNPLLVNMRRSICKECPNNINGKCTVCGCILEIKTATKTNRTRKGTIEITHCPEGRWADEQTKQIYKNK